MSHPDFSHHLQRAFMWSLLTIIMLMNYDEALSVFFFVPAIKAVPHLRIVFNAISDYFNSLD